MELEPTETFPNPTLAGLALSAAGATDDALVVFVVLAALAVVVVELPFALVTPAQPESIAVENKSVPERNRIRTRETGRAQVWRETLHVFELWARMIMTRKV